MIEYHIFDIVSYASQSERWKLLKEIYASLPADMKLKLITRELIHSWEEAKEFFARVVAQNYEGIILRAYSAPYQHKRSLYLRKYKEMMDREAEIVGFEDGKGNDKNKVIWIVRWDKNENDPSEGKVEFAVRPAGGDEMRLNQFLEAESYIGKFITVRYQEINASGKPKFPVGVAVRDYE
jgi:DNA ligase-1